MSVFVIKQEKFEGPLDALLNLIERQKLHVTDVSLANITEGFVNLIQEQPIPIEQVAEFVHTASILLLIKARTLLPHFTITDTEAVHIDLLKLRLACLEYVRSVQHVVEDNWNLEVPFSVHHPKFEGIVFAPDTRVTKDSLVVMALALLQQLPQPPKEKATVRVQPTMSIQDMMGQLIGRLEKELRYSFKEFTQKHARHKVDVIVGFLALLELCKLGRMKAEQHAPHGDILLETTDVATPNYSI